MRLEFTAICLAGHFITGKGLDYRPVAQQRHVSVRLVPSLGAHRLCPRHMGKPMEEGIGA